MASWKRRRSYSIPLLTFPSKPTSHHKHDVYHMWEATLHPSYFQSRVRKLVHQHVCPTYCRPGNAPCSFAIRADAISCLRCVMRSKMKRLVATMASPTSGASSTLAGTRVDSCCCPSLLPLLRLRTCKGYHHQEIWTGLSEQYKVYPVF